MASDEEDESCLVEPPKCSICQENMLVSGSPDCSVTPCGHLYHNKCITQWLLCSRSPTCPECREDMGGGVLELVYLYVELEKRNADAWKEELEDKESGSKLLAKWKGNPAKLEKLVKWLLDKRTQDASAYKALEKEKHDLELQLDGMEERWNQLQDTRLDELEHTRQLENQITKLTSKLSKEQAENQKLQEKVNRAEVFEAVKRWADNPQGILQETRPEDMSQDVETLQAQLSHHQLTNKVLMREHRRLKKVKDAVTEEVEQLRRSLAKAKQSVAKRKEKFAEVMGLKNLLQSNIAEYAAIVDSQIDPVFSRGLLQTPQASLASLPPCQHKLSNKRRSSHSSKRVKAASSSNELQSSSKRKRVEKDSFLKRGARSKADESKFLREGVDPLGNRQNFRMTH